MASFAAAERFPLVVKPVESAGADGFKLCHSMEEAESCFREPPPCGPFREPVPVGIASASARVLVVEWDVTVRFGKKERGQKGFLHVLRWNLEDGQSAEKRPQKTDLEILWGTEIPQIVSYSSFLSSGIHLGVQKKKILILDFGEKG